ncbi:ATP-binding protein [Streptomyces sp. TLI_171]|uniref:ATP-binding protein n=1 Tax=Streptomyces sp. TLI_171 TaxID=1938859 RepID=UPI00217DE1F2|nr:ATP-binding protein [Streptomyces sp. TLI_171]
MAPDQDLHRHLSMFPGDPSGAAVAFARRTLADWGINGTSATDVLLVTAELLANAAQHTPGPRRLDLYLHRHGLTAAVTDPSPDPPRVRRPYRPDAPDGHGLVIVDRLALAWGHRPAPTGKMVWALLPAPARRPNPL